MAFLRGIIVIGLLQLVAVPTITTPLPQNLDEFADQLKGLEDVVKKLPTNDFQIDSDVKIDDMVDDLMDLKDDEEKVAGAIDQFIDDDVLDDLRDELLGEANDELENELGDLSDIDDIVPTVIQDVVDELIDQLMNVNSNKSTVTTNSPSVEITDATSIGVSSTTKSFDDDDDDLVNDLLDLEIVEEIASEVVTEVVSVTEPFDGVGDDDGSPYPTAMSMSPVDMDDVDYELVTELDMVTEVVYDAVFDDVTLPVTGTMLDDAPSVPSDYTLPPQESEAIRADELTTIQNTKEPVVTDVFTEIVTELQTETELLLTELDNGLMENTDCVDDDKTQMTPTEVPDDDEDLELELWDLQAATDEMMDGDNEPTFVFTTPYPSIVGSTEYFDMGPDLEVTTVKSGLSCPDDRFACADGSQCILQDTVCDIMFDCSDGSDESPNVCQPDRECPTGFTKCSRSPQCIEDKDWCDGVYHCYNGVDEKDCMSCVGLKGDVKALLIEDFCDGVQDCEDNRDETSERCHHPCPLGSSKCADGLQCIKDFLFCNGFQNCRDGSDETKDCARTHEECDQFEMFSCDGICVTKSALCDEMPDCRDGVDEKGCSNDMFSCPNGFARRKGDHTCVHQSLLKRRP